MRPLLLGFRLATTPGVFQLGGRCRRTKIWRFFSSLWRGTEIPTSFPPLHIAAGPCTEAPASASTVCTVRRKTSSFYCAPRSEPGRPPMQCIGGAYHATRLASRAAGLEPPHTQTETPSMSSTPFGHGIGDISLKPLPSECPSADPSNAESHLRAANNPLVSPLLNLTVVKIEPS